MGGVDSRGMAVLGVGGMVGRATAVTGKATVAGCAQAANDINKKSKKNIPGFTGMDRRVAHIPPPKNQSVTALICVTF
jgi:hypothetical protein